MSGPASAQDRLRLLLLDNYDSFTWNLAQYLQELGTGLDVRLNDKVSCAQVSSGDYDAVVLSPGPGRPEEAGVCVDLVRELAGRRPLLGVCLGHQAIAQAFGARIVRAPTLMHGKTSPIVHDGRGLFRGVRQGFEATRYHSLVVDAPTLPQDFAVTARTEDGVLMALQHRLWPLYGVQFHPESVMTVEGKGLLANFLELVRQWRHGTIARAGERW